MNIDDVLEWIAKKNVEIALKMNNLSAFEKANHAHETLRDYLDILRELRHYILMKTNPHNREDIKRIQDSYE